MIISYSLFNGLIKQVDYDPFRTVENRYWLNIPTIIEANMHYFPHSKTVIHATLEITKHPWYPKLLDLHKQKLLSLNMFVGLPNPMAWRMAPVWFAKNEVVFTRDLDSVMNTLEADCMKEFLDSDSNMFKLHTIKSHPDHKDLFMLGGLSGFRQPRLVGSFRDYLNFSGSDQDRLKTYFSGQDVLISNYSNCIFSKNKREIYYDQITTWPGQPVLCQKGL